MPNTPQPARGPRTPLKDAGVTVPARAAGRRRDVPGHRPVPSVTFDSAL
ncbi:hypothetical protein [Streptomyces sp. NPDC059759]